MIYVPDTTYKCYVLVDKDTIRAYKIKPYNPGYNQSISIDYRDYYINSHYLYKDGVQQFSNYTTLPICLDSNLITDNYYHRADFTDILVTFSIILGTIFFVFYIMLKALLRGSFRWD